MGVETDYVMADESSYEQIWKSYNPSQDFDGVYGKGTDPISLADLYACVSGEKVELEIIDDYQPIKTDESGERTLLRVPDKIRDTFASINESNIEEIVDRWATTEGFMMTGWGQEMAKEFIYSLSCYIRKHQGKQLLMWMCV